MRSKGFRQVMKAEAVKRMRRLRISDDAIDMFESEDKLSLSFYVLQKEVPTEILSEIRAWEKEYGNIVYHVVYSRLYGYEIYNALSVSKYIEDWDYETTMIDKGRTMAYTINVSKPDFSESGTIILENHRGTLQRII
jgi:hypothetical protein